MKLILLGILLLGLTSALSSCTESHASSSHKHDAPPPENGAQYKEGKGIALTEVMAQSIDLKVAEVQEEDMTPVFIAELQSVQRGNEASGWISADQAARVQTGMKVDLRVPGHQNIVSGTVTRLEKSLYGAGGDFEVAVAAPTDLKAGTAINATFRLEPAEGLTAIPKSALLTTAEGKFVYAKNGEYYVRTPVKTGAVSDAYVEVLDGLYTGDEIVTAPIMSLWLAELQILRGGKACTCGH